MKHKFTLDYLKSLHEDEFIHWTAVHMGPSNSKWGENEGYIWNERLKQFLIQQGAAVTFMDDTNIKPYISRFFKDRSNEVIIATNYDFGIAKVTDRNKRGDKGTVQDNINGYMSQHYRFHSASDLDMNSDDLYIVTHPENGGGFPEVYDIFNHPPDHIKRIYSKGLMCINHEKFRPLPNGICNLNINNIRKKTIYHEEKTDTPLNLLVLNFRDNTNVERLKLYDYYQDQFWATFGNGSQYEYLREMYHHKFVLSPESNCADSHRTWEALYMGSIPIVQKTPTMSVVDDLPILQVDDITKCDPAFLKDKYEEMMEQEWNLDKLKMSYWLDQIKEDL